MQWSSCNNFSPPLHRPMPCKLLTSHTDKLPSLWPLVVCSQGTVGNGNNGSEILPNIPASVLTGDQMWDCDFNLPFILNVWLWNSPSLPLVIIGEYNLTYLGKRENTVNSRYIRQDNFFDTDISMRNSLWTLSPDLCVLIITLLDFSLAHWWELYWGWSKALVWLDVSHLTMKGRSSTLPLPMLHV